MPWIGVRAGKEKGPKGAFSCWVVGVMYSVLYGGLIVPIAIQEARGGYMAYPGPTGRCAVRENATRDRDHEAICL